MAKLQYLLQLDSRRRGSLGRIGRKQDMTYSIAEMDDGVIVLTPVDSSTLVKKEK